MKSILMMLTLFLAMSTAAFAQNKTIALLEPLGGEGSVISGMDKAIVRGELRKGIQKLDGFTTVTRTDIDQMMKEQNFQRTGMVSDEQRKKLGEMAGADYICVSTINKSQSEFYLEAYLIELETGKISNPATQYGEMVNGKFSDLLTICEKLAQELCNATPSKQSSNHTNKSTKQSNTYGQTFTETELGLDLKMVYVEGNQSQVGYYIGIFEVTQKQWELVMGTSIYQQQSKAIGTKFRGIGSDYPMYFVSWEDAMAFCKKLSRLTGKKYTLPTESQWEYAARGGKRHDGTNYSGSNSIDLVAWYYDNSGHTTHTVGSKQANGLGIYDMSGNVSEWCEDLKDIRGSNRIIRGGAWDSLPSYCHIAFRGSYLPDVSISSVGFRVVLIP